MGRLWEIVKDRKAWCAAFHGVAKSRTRLTEHLSVFVFKTKQLTESLIWLLDKGLGKAPWLRESEVLGAPVVSWASEAVLVLSCHCSGNIADTQNIINQEGNCKALVAHLIGYH